MILWATDSPLRPLLLLNTHSQKQARFTTVLFQAGKCSISKYIFTDRLGELWSTANNLLLLSPVKKRTKQTQKEGIVSVQNYWVCSKLLTL